MLSIEPFEDLLYKSGGIFSDFKEEWDRTIIHCVNELKEKKNHIISVNVEKAFDRI